MILQQATNFDAKTLEKIIEEDKNYPTPTNKAYFEDVIAIDQSTIMANQVISFLNDYFLVKSPSGLIENEDYFVNVFKKKEKQNSVYGNDKDNFSDIRTVICFSNIKNKYSFIVSYIAMSEMYYISFQKDYIFNTLEDLQNDKKEFFGFIAVSTYYTLAFANLVYEYLDKGVLDLESSITSVITH